MSEPSTNEPRFGAPTEVREHNWAALGMAALLVVAVLVAGLALWRRPASVAGVPAANAAVDPYAAKLAVTNVAMSESANLAGGKVTYLDGQIANHGERTVTGIMVQVLFRNGAHEVAQNETLPLKVIRMREPYIDTETMAAAPLKPGAKEDFRLIFDAVSPEWDGAYPELRVLHVETR